MQARHYIDSMKGLPLTALLLACLASPCWPAATPYGKYYLLASAAGERGQALPATGDPGAKSASEAGLATAQAALEARLASQEVEQGPYAPMLAETLSDLARVLDARGDVEGALSLRERALHLVRVNEGLYSATQGPLVRAMLASLRRSGAFDALDERYDYFFRLYGAGQPPFSDLRWAAALEYFAWQREALLRDLDGDPGPRLLELYELNDSLLESLNDAPERDWQKLRDASLSQLDTLYLIADLIEPREDLDPRYSSIMRRPEPREFDVTAERLASLRRLAGARGSGLLEDALLAIPASEERARLELRLALADWLQWQGSAREALEQYQAIWQEAADAGLEDLRARWFSVPVALPASGVFELSERAGSDAIPVTLRVQENGRARVEEIDVEESRRRDASRLRRHLQASRFRPVFEDGQPVDAGILRSDWILLDN